MKKFYLLFSLFFCTALLLPFNNQLNGQELPDNSLNTHEIQESFELILPQKINKKTGDRLQAINFTTFDSLANGYSYFSIRQQPFTYEEETNTLVTIKRGANPSTAGGDNILNNLFIRTSNDWGLTWNDPILAYNALQEGYQNARYPSVDPIVTDPESGELSFVYTGPLVNTNATLGWWGMLNGIYTQGIAVNVPSQNSELQLDGQNGFWWTTSSGILGGLVDQEPFAVAVGETLPNAGNINGSYEYNSYLLTRRTTDFGFWPYSVPEYWNSSNFQVPDADSTSMSSLVKLRHGTDGRMYMGAHAAFDDIEYDGLFVPGVSISGDNGETWSEFDMLPVSVVEDYCSMYGFNIDSLVIQNYDMYVIDEDNLGFAVSLWDISTGDAIYELSHHITEIYKEDGAWGMRKIAEPLFFWLYYRDVANNVNSIARNQLRFELQCALTEDRSKVLFKWVETIDFEESDGSVVVPNTDIFAAYREIGSSEWNGPKNMTNSEEFDRITWIPDLIPSDLVDIPVIRLVTKLTADMNQQDSIIALFDIETNTQYVQMGHFDGSAILSVDDNENELGSIEIKNIYPNPAVSEAEILFNIPAAENVEITLFDLMGRKVLDIYEGTVTAGTHSVRADVNALSAGTYYCTLKAGGRKITKIMTIVR